MDTLPPALAHALLLPPVLKYAAVVLISMFEGPVLFTVSGFLLRLQGEHLLPFFIVLGNLLGDTLWYCVGYFFARKVIQRHGSLLGISSEHIATSERLFRKYQGRLLFFSKATLGFGTSVGIPATLMAAGMSKVPFKKYLLLTLAGEALLFVLFMTVGYVFGLSYQSVSKDLRLVALAVLAVAGICCLILVRLYLSRKGMFKEGAP